MRAPSRTSEGRRAPPTNRLCPELQTPSARLPARRAERTTRAQRFAPAYPEHVPVEARHVRREALAAPFHLNKLASRAADARGERVVFEQRHEARRESLRVAVRVQEARPPFEHYLGDAVNGRRDDGASARHRFEYDERQALEVCAEDEHVEGAHQP